MGDKPEEFDNLTNEEHVAVDLKGTGIDLTKLRSGKETLFEVDSTSVSVADENDGRYFDAEELFKQLNYECIDDSCESGDEMSSPFTKIQRDMVDITDGRRWVFKKIIKHGSGPIVPATALCRVHYNAYVEHSDEPFDSSRLRNRQQQFKLSSGEGIEGWIIAVSTMKRGELSRFLLDPAVAYGKTGCPPRIPANAQVLFEIELVSFVDQEAADVFENFSEEERRKATFDEILKVVDSLRLTGNEVFSIKQFGRAAGKYSHALRLLENAHLADEKEEAVMKRAALKLYLNLSLCNLKQTRYGRACKYARKALDVDPKNMKALYRLARSMHRLGEYNDARRHIVKAHRLEPSNEDVMVELKRLDIDIREARSASQSLSRKMLNLEVSNVSVKDEKDERVVVGKKQSQMVQVVKETLKGFLENSEEEMILPNNLTEDEYDSISQAVLEMDLNLIVSNKNDEKLVCVLKKMPAD